MLPEILAVLAGHDSSLFIRNGDDIVLSEAFAPLLHPGEKSSITSLARLASLYAAVRDFGLSAPYPNDEYICALCSAITVELKQYDALVVRTEALILAKDDSLVASGSFVPLSALVATFSKWDAPLSSLSYLVAEIRAGPPGDAHQDGWPPGALIDLVYRRSQTGYSRVAEVMTHLFLALQRIFIHHLTLYLLHGSTLSPGSIPSFVSPETKESITYVGDAVARVKKEGWGKAIPRSMVTEWTTRLAKANISQGQRFDKLIAEMRIAISEWLWTNVLTKEDVTTAIDTLSNYFLLRNGEFAVSFIREVERLKRSRLEKGSRMMLVRAQDLNHTLLRSSLGTTAEADPSLAKLLFSLPEGPVPAFLPSLDKSSVSFSGSNAIPNFASLLIGKPAHLTYPLDFPLSLFLTPAALKTYTDLHAYLSAIRRSHIVLLNMWSSLSSAQRVRRKWVRLGEGGGGGRGGEEGDRTRLLRKTWGCVREMVWFLDILWGYIGGDAIDGCYWSFKEQLGVPTSKGQTLSGSRSQYTRSPTPTVTDRPSTPALGRQIDFTTLRVLHNTYLSDLTSLTLISAPALASTIYDILGTCERLVAQVERWGGDVLPDLLGAKNEGPGGMLERRRIVDEVYETFTEELRSFYSLLSTSPLTSHAAVHTDASVLLNGSSFINASMYSVNGTVGPSVHARRQVEHLMLKLDFNGAFSDPGFSASAPDADPAILKDLGGT